MSELLGFEWAVGAGPVSIQETGLRLALAIVLSGLVGIDRELKHKPLGLRTNMLVALGAASFSLMAMRLVDVLGSGPTEIQIDPGRVMEAIVSAILDDLVDAPLQLGIGTAEGFFRRQQRDRGAATRSLFLHSRSRV